MNHLLSLLSLLASFCFCQADVATLPQLAQVIAEIQKEGVPTPEPIVNTPEVSGKKTIIVFISKGGGGHVAAAKAITAIAQDEYNVKVVNLLDELLPKLDPLKTFTFGKFNGEDMYNYALQKGWVNFLNMMVPWGAWTVRAKQSSIEEILSKYVQTHKPSLLVSVIPLFNSPFLNIAEKYSLPFLVATTDLDSSNYINGLCRPTYDKFHYIIPFDDRSIRKKLRPAKIPGSSIKVWGFPLREEFFTAKDIPTIKKDFTIPEGKPVVMLLMGAAGSGATLQYCKELVKVKKPMHLLICIGRNEKLRSKIEKIEFPATTSISIVGFTDRIADLMAVSTVLITKPGPTTVCEALSLNLPMILDYTTKCLFWERMNIDFVKKNKFGTILTNIKKLDRTLSLYLSNPTHGEAIRRKMARFKKGDFAKNFKTYLKNNLGQVAESAIIY